MPGLSQLRERSSSPGRATPPGRSGTHPGLYPVFGPPGEVKDRVAARLARQSLFSRERQAAFSFYLHESALRLPVGGSAVMA